MPTIDLRADLNSEDDEGRWWSLRSDAADPAAVVRSRPGRRDRPVLVGRAH
jgi:hypothetical protein